MAKKEKRNEKNNLKDELEKCAEQRDEYLAGWQRAKADFLNYKKQEMERVEEILKYANLNLILKILLILDNFEKAKKQAQNMKYEETKSKDMINGFLNIKTQLKDFLKEQGIEGIECIGKKFDPNFHEAIEEIEIKDQESNTIVEEIEKGYILNSRVIRPAKVKVAK